MKVVIQTLLAPTINKTERFWLKHFAVPRSITHNTAKEDLP